LGFGQHGLFQSAQLRLRPSAKDPAFLLSPVVFTERCVWIAAGTQESIEP